MKHEGFGIIFYKKRSKRQMSWGLTRCVALHPFLCGRKRFVEADMNLVSPYCEMPELFGKSEDTVDFAALIMDERNIKMPRIHIKQKTFL